MKEITQGVDNINLAANSYKKNRIQVSNTKKPLFFYVILAKVSYAATLHSLLISDESYRPIIGSKRHILYSLLLIITVANVPSRSIKDALKALFGIALYQLNQASLVGLGVVPALVSLIVRDASTGIVEDATAVLAQIAGCKESEEAMRKAGGFRVFCDLLDEWTGASGRIRENAVAALLNLAWCGGENGRKEVREMGAKVMEGITEVAENGSAKGKNKAVELLKFIVDRNGNGNEEKAIQEQNTMLAKQIKERQKRVAQQLQWGQQDHSLNTSSFVLPQPHPCLNIGYISKRKKLVESLSTALCL